MESLPGGSMHPRPDATDRLDTALAVVAQVEGGEDALPATTERLTFWCRGRVARRPHLPLHVAGLVPARDRSGWGADRTGVQTRTQEVAADLVVLAKFDVGAHTKLRAAYADRALSLAVQPPAPSGVDGIARAVRAYAVVAPHAPSLIPKLVAHGRVLDGLSYLVEEWLDGVSLVTGDELAEAAPEVLAAMNRVREGHGLSLVRVSEHWPLLPQLWQQTAASGLVPEALARWVSTLIAREGLMTASWVHGDLVASNMMATSDGIALIDWEYAHVGPVMSDGAKLHLFSSDPEATLATVLEAFGSTQSRANAQAVSDGYTPTEELALAHANLISHYPLRKARLVGHPRAGVYERQVRRQIVRLGDVYSVDGT